MGKKKRRRKERGELIQFLRQLVTTHSLLCPLPYGRDRHLWRGERPRPRPVCYFKIVIRPPSPPSSVLAVNTPLDRHRPVGRGRDIGGNIFPLARCDSWFGFFSSNPTKLPGREPTSDPSKDMIYCSAMRARSHSPSPLLSCPNVSPETDLPVVRHVAAAACVMCAVTAKLRSSPSLSIPETSNRPKREM